MARALASIEAEIAAFNAPRSSILKIQTSKGL
jgi:hypothetical protein